MNYRPFCLCLKDESDSMITCIVLNCISLVLPDDQRNLNREGLRCHTQRGTGRACLQYQQRTGLSVREMKRPCPSGLQSIS